MNARCLTLAAGFVLAAALGADAHAAARSSTAPISVAVLEALCRARQNQQRELSCDAVASEAREQAALARLARQTHDEATLFPDASVGFAVDVAGEDRVVGLLRGLYRERLEAELAALPGGKLESLAVELPEPAQSELQSALGPPAGMRLEYRLTPAQIERARALVVLRYRLTPAAPLMTLDLAELYRRQNVQGRIALHSFDRQHLRAEALRYLAGRFVLDRITRWHGTEFVAALHGWVDDREVVGALARWYGVGADAHDEVAHLATLATQVTRADIRRYYYAHRDEFRRIDRVHARHIRCADENEARRVASAFAKPSDIAALARRYSIAPDAPSGGDLGWIDARHHDWLGDLAFAQAPGKVGRPTREPVAETVHAAWEIVVAEAQQTSFHAVDSETVAWQARHAIARARAAAEFQALRRQAQREANASHREPG